MLSQANVLRIELANLVIVQEYKVMSRREAAQVKAGLQRGCKRHQGAGFIFLGDSIGVDVDAVLRIRLAYFNP